jgi:hypothetical protein
MHHRRRGNGSRVVEGHPEMKIPPRENRALRICGIVRAMMTDAEFEQRWWETLMACVFGHAAGCTYGGMSQGYWIYRDECTENHGERCDICGGEVVTDFRGMAPDDQIVWVLWKVMCCRSCAYRSESPTGHGGGTGSPSSSSTPAPNDKPRQRATSAPYRPAGQHPAQPHARQQPRPSAAPSPSPSPTP